MRRATLQDRLVNLCFQSLGEVGGRAERSEERRGPRQIALGLCDSRHFRDAIHIVGCDIENLIKLSERFGETTKVDIGKRVLREEVNIARIEPVGFVEVLLAPVPLALSPCDKSELLRNPAAIWQELTCLLKVTHGGVVIL